MDLGSTVPKGLLREAVGIVKNAEACFSKNSLIKLNLTEYLILDYIRAMGPKCPQSNLLQISENLPATSLSGIINKLVKMGLVDRSTEGRTNLLSATSHSTSELANCDIAIKALMADRINKPGNSFVSPEERTLSLGNATTAYSFLKALRHDQDFEFQPHKISPKTFIQD